MDDKVIQLIQLIVQQSWRLLTGWKLPGLNITPASFLFFIALFPLIVAVFKSLVGLTMDAISSWGRNK